MGNCFGQDVQSKYAAGGIEPTGSLPRAGGAIDEAANEAVSLMSGSLAYSSWVELHLECRKLKDVDMFSKSDPLGVLYELQDGSWREAGRTELIANSLNPSFVKRFRVLFNFEKVQRYKVVIYDVDVGQDPDSINPKECEHLGEAEFELSEVVTAKGKRLSRVLTKQGGGQLEGGKSSMVLVAEEVANCKEVYTIKLQAAKLANREAFGKSDPFLVISRLQEDGVSWLPVYKTSVVKDNLNPTWPDLIVRATQLNNGDVYRPLRIEVFDYEADGDHDAMGWCEISTQRMQDMAAQPGSVVELQPPKGRSPGNYGTLQVLSFTVETQSSFIDYLAGGTEIGFIVATDFTASNGDPNSPDSKHFFSAGSTQYEKAIMGIGKVIEHYDADKIFPMYGFGGSYQRGPANHCFPMGPNPDGTCHGVSGLLQAYRQALCVWQLSGPTLFAPIVRKAAEVARATVGSVPPKYTCLLILTDGAIMDMAETTNAIIEASTLPLSILIVGIGKEDFGNMNTLDGDEERLSSGKRTVARDIVQFVEFDKFAGDGTRLAQELLAELPGQLLEYMKMNKIKCPPPVLSAPTLSRTPAPPTGPPTAPPPPFAAVLAPTAPPPGMPPVGMPPPAGMPPVDPYGVPLSATASVHTGLMHVTVTPGAA